MNTRGIVGLGVGLVLAGNTLAQEPVSSISQNGITWHFEKPVHAGQFITGDWWVVGPVTISHVDPAPGPAPEAAADAKSGTVKSRYGDTSMKDDPRMRNGSMIVTEAGRNQGYDSRLINFNPESSVSFPLELPVNRSLISTISNETNPAPVLHEAIMWTSEKKGVSALESASVLTCLPTKPPADAFRPPFAGVEKPIYRWSDIRWDLLPSLDPPAEIPSWEQFARYVERPWLDHVSTWVYQDMGPRKNQVNYGRENARIGGMIGLMLMLDVPREQKEPLMRGFVQLGIDAAGLARAGRIWAADGGHWNGRKWPILFAGLMLNDESMLELVRSGDFSENRQTYYGKGWFGETALFQISFHTTPQPPYEEKPPAEWGPSEKRQEGYRASTISAGWIGTALAVQLMKSKAAWNHDAFFDYTDRWMRQNDPFSSARGENPRPKSEGKSFDAFVDRMWAMYRNQVPPQPDAGSPTKWVWDGKDREGRYVPNPEE